MTNVRDLHIDSEILPLFDYTNSSSAKNILTGLFNNLPQSVDEILLRQNIIKGFIDNWSVLHSFSYSRAELKEIFEFVNTFKNDRFLFGKNKLNLRIQLILAESKLQQTRSKLTQLILLFHKFYTRYFSLIKKDSFPNEFRAKLETYLIFFLVSISINTKN